MDYMVGVALEEVPRHEDLGANRLSWCMRHTYTSLRYRPAGVTRMNTCFTEMRQEAFHQRGLGTPLGFLRSF